MNSNDSKSQDKVAMYWFFRAVFLKLITSYLSVFLVLGVYMAVGDRAPLESIFRVENGFLAFGVFVLVNAYRNIDKSIPVVDDDMTIKVLGALDRVGVDWACDWQARGAFLQYRNAAVFTALSLVIWFTIYVYHQLLNVYENKESWVVTLMDKSINVDIIVCLILFVPVVGASVFSVGAWRCVRDNVVNNNAY